MLKYKVNNLNEIVDVIVPFFKIHLYNYSKGLDFILWSDILDMMLKKYHLSNDGIKSILKIIKLIRKNKI